MDLYPNAETLMRQAWKTAAEYMDHAKEEIDRAFGDGYAAEHPELVAAFMETAARDFAASLLSTRIESTAETLRGTVMDAIEEVFERMG